MIITKEGKIGLAVSNGKYCVKKGYNDEDVIIDENINDCEIPPSFNPNVSSTDTCIKDIATTCANKTEVEVQVNNNESYNFYVIKDTGEELTLIMDRNLGDQVSWMSKADYIAAGGLEADYRSNGNTKGPITALNYLETQTSTWINVPTMSYTLTDDGGNNLYNPITRTNVRARMLTYTEATALGCIQGSHTSCPRYLYNNLSNASRIETYLLSSASARIYSDTISDFVWTVYYYGYITEYSAHTQGVRPVITIPKMLS